MNITILDINDNAPVWRDEPYHANVVEMSPINTDVITVSTLTQHKTTPAISSNRLTKRRKGATQPFAFVPFGQQEYFTVCKHRTISIYNI